MQKERHHHLECKLCKDNMRQRKWDHSSLLYCLSPFLPSLLLSFLSSFPPFFSTGGHKSLRVDVLTWEVGLLSSSSCFILFSLHPGHLSKFLSLLGSMPGLCGYKSFVALLFLQCPMMKILTSRGVCPSSWPWSLLQSHQSNCVSLGEFYLKRHIGAIYSESLRWLIGESNFTRQC